MDQLIFPQTKAAFEIKKDARYYVPLAPMIDRLTGMSIPVVVLAKYNGKNFVTSKKDAQDGSKRTIPVEMIDQSRNLIPMRDRKKSEDLITFPNRYASFELEHNQKYQVPVKGKDRKVVEAIYKSPGTFLSLRRHPDLKVRYTIPVRQIDQTRNITKVVP